MCSSNHCFIFTSKSPQDTPLFSSHILCSSLNELSSQLIKLSFLLSSIIHMYFAISWNEFFFHQLFFYKTLLFSSPDEWIDSKKLFNFSLLFLCTFSLSLPRTAIHLHRATGPESMSTHERFAQSSVNYSIIFIF